MLGMGAAAVQHGMEHERGALLAGHGGHHGRLALDGPDFAGAQAALLVLLDSNLPRQTQSAQILGMPATES